MTLLLSHLSERVGVERTGRQLYVIILQSRAGGGSKRSDWRKGGLFLCRVLFLSIIWKSGKATQHDIMATSYPITAFSMSLLGRD